MGAFRSFGFVAEKYFCRMLQKISVHNYALIDELHLDFDQGLTIITGETGAGKSILLGALQLLLGERADTSVLLDTGRKCIIEGIFKTDKLNLTEFFLKHDLDEENLCILRREINAKGKSRAFVNDTPVNLSQLKELGGQLVDIHSQHDNLLLETSAFQTRLVDAFAGNQTLFKTYQKEFMDWKELNAELIKKKENAARIAAEQDFLNFQIQELEGMRLEPNESAILEEEFRRLDHATEIVRQLSQAEHLLESESGGILAYIRQLSNLISPLAKYTQQGAELGSRIHAVDIELRDIHNELQDFRELSEADPERLENIGKRLDKINHLLGKHRLTHSDELIRLCEKMSDQLKWHSEQESRIESLESEMREKEKHVEHLANELHESRKRAIPEIQDKILNLLKRMGMPESKIEIRLEELEKPGFYGSDKVSIYFTANAGIEPREIHKVASGGELSRLMLALKKIIAQSVALPSIVFDEIDTGVSGALADAMGEVLQEMAGDLQVITITHLPQIASKANDHLKVVKTTISGGARTEVRRLNKKERIAEIAGMLSGKELSGEAISNAETLLGIRKK